MDGDEEQRSAAVAVCDGATGDAAAVIAEADPPAAWPATAVPTDPAEADADDAGTDAAGTGDVSDQAAPGETPAESAAVEDSGSVALGAGDGEAEPEPEPVGAAPAACTPRRIHPYRRRGAVALVAVGVVALALTAFARGIPSLKAANEQFVEAAQSQGYDIAPGEQETLVLSAARKVCDRQRTHATDRERRSAALTSQELAAVGAAFGAETRDFTALALDTYCSG